MDEEDSRRRKNLSLHGVFPVWIYPEEKLETMKEAWISIHKMINRPQEMADAADVILRVQADAITKKGEGE
jgi:hypothetical protein